MNKYQSVTTLKETKARNQHACSICGNIISLGEHYYKEYIDKFIQVPHAKKYCSSCKKNRGKKISPVVKERPSITLDNFELNEK